jgi:flagellar basal-body rod modification protein FlgD
MNTISDTKVFEDLGLQQRQEDKKADTIGQKDFLMLMTTQLRNQDPFKPMENGEFMGQMAQFSTVSGIQELQSAFRDLADSLYSNQALQAAGMVGHEVLVANRHGEYTGEVGLSGAVDLPDAVNNLTISVHDGAGRLVRTMELGRQPAGMASFSWDGYTDAGEAAPPGQYEFRAEAANGEAHVAFDVLVAAKVRSVTLPALGAPLTLDLAGIGQMNFSEVRQIR